MRELTYFERTIQGERTGNLRIMYELKIEYMLPIGRDIERYWRATIVGTGRFLVNTSEDNPTLPQEAFRELAEIYNDWLEMNKAYANG